VAEQIIKRLQELQKVGASVSISGVLEQARSFEKYAKRLDSAAAQARAHSKQATGNEMRRGRLNRAMKRISRHLVPLMSSAIGKYGHDPYGFGPQTTMMPALYDVTRVAKLSEGEERWMLETKAVRDRNRVADARGRLRSDHSGRSASGCTGPSGLSRTPARNFLNG
jgi:hypothetical protein